MFFKNIFKKAYWSDYLMKIKEEYLPKYKTVSKRMSSFNQLPPEKKMLMHIWATQKEAFVFRDIMLDSWVTKELHDLAMLSEEITNEGKARAERIRGAIARLTQIRQFLEQARQWKPPIKEEKK